MNAANQRNSTPKWSDVANDQDFQSADWETRQKVRGEFYRRVVEPETPAELREEVQGKFFTQTEPDVFGERDSSADSERFSYPGAAADQSALDERQQNETGLRASQQNNEEEAPGLASNALRNAGERGLDLAGNAVQFVGNMAEMGEKLITDHLGGLNPGVIGGESDAMRERGYEPDMELGGYGLDFTARAKPEDTDTGMTGAGQAVEDVGLGYQPNYTIDRALDNPSVETLAGAAAEQGPAALADMAGLAINLPAYLASRTQEIGESRAQNEGRDGMPEGGDYAVAGPTAAASVLLDRFALGRLLPGGKGAVSKASQVPGAVGRATATEATTEAVQEGGIEYAGESLGTEQGWDPVTAGRRAAGGAIVGGPTGGAVRAGTAAAEVAGGRASIAKEESGQADNSPEEESSPETQQANEEAVGAAAELIRRPRFELSSSEREVRDSITYGDAFKSLRAAAEAQGDTEAVAELDAVSEEVSSALEDETLARSSGEEDAIEPIRQRLDGAAQRFTSTMERINSQRSDSQSPENDIERAAAETDTEPTPAQAEAGNYRKGKVRLNGFEIAIENPKGSTRRGTAQDGTEWESQMAHHYGDIKGTTAADGDNLDVFVGENPSSPQAYIIDQVDEDGGFDEHKVMLGFDSLDDARQGYLDNYEDGWKGLGEISETSVEDFRQWVREGNTRAPFAMPDTQTRDEGDQSDEESASRQKETTYLADDTPVDTRFRVMDMADVTPSNRADGQVNPSFPPELQPRDRTNANSQVQVRNIAARLNPERLGSSPDAGSGAPITGPDGVVESGNGRAMAIATAYRQGGERAEGYRDFVRAQAEERGIKADLDGMRRPMLVRERTSDLDRADFARRANESQVAGMTSYEQAQTDADAMTADDVQSWSPDQSGDPLAASNRDFQRAFVSRLGNNEASRYTTRQGQAAPELGRRMSRAVFAKAYADPDMVELITEQGDQMRNLSSALQSAAPDLAMARETGSQDALDTIATINDAVRLVRASRRDGAPIRELVSQADAFSEPTSELTADLAILVNTNMRSRASLEQALGFVAQDARRRAESDRNGALFEDATTSEDAIREGFRQAPAEDIDGQRAPEDDVPGRPDEGEQEPSQRREADPSEGAAEAQEVSDSPLLESYTEQDVAEREQAAQKAQEEETRTRREDEQRAAADREADDFALSGSSLPADQANARGQDPLFAFAGEGAQNAEPAASEPVSAPRAEAIRARLSEHPELSGVEVVQSARELPTQVQLVMAMQGVEASDVSGVYNPDTGAPMIVADNLIDEADGVRKAVHEGVGHYGIRGMLGEELEPLMLEIYQSHTRSDSGRQNIEEIQQTYPFIDVATRKGKITLAEELVAHYIEGSNGRPKLGQRIMSTIRRLLRKLFPGIQWRTSDILAMGDQARRWLRRQQAARDVGDSDNRYSFSEQQEELSAQDLAAQLREEYPGLKLDMASRGQKATISRIVAPEREQGTGSAVMRRLTDWADASGRTMALTPSSDFGGSVKRLHEFYRRFGFVENKGRNKDYEISEAMYREPDHGVGDVRFSLTQQPGTVGGKYSSTDSTGFSMPDESLRNAALRKMADKMRPLKILEDAIRRTGRDIEEEADAYLAEELFHGKVEHDLRQLREQHVEPLAEGLAKANLSQAELDDYLYARHAPERNATTAERNPDNPEMQDGGSGMTNAQAAEIIERVANSGKQAEYDRLANIVYDMTRLRREAIRDGGLEDDAMIDAWEANWQYYVPLKGNASDDPGRPRTGRGFEISGRESRIAGGRTSLAESPSSQVIVDVNESLIRRRKNEVAQSLLSLVTDNPNPALWEVFTDENPDTQRTPTRITDPETGQTRVEVQERPVNMAGNDRYFKAKRAGRTYYLKLHDERLMNAMRNVGPENNGVLIRAAGAVTRVMSSLVTSYNPEFMLTNFARDVQTALLNLSAEQTRDDGKIKGEAVVRQTARDIAPSMRAAWRGLRGKAGKNDGSREWDQWFREFQEDGAKTGYFDMKDLNAQAKEIQSMIRRADGTTLSHMLKARKKTADFVENMNGAVENAVRLSAYANARRAGVSRKKAASLAKNMTVNFNRRGEAGTALNAAYMFANASIQGTMNFARTMVTVKNAPEGKSQMNVWARMNMAQKLGLGMATGSFMLGMLNRWLSDEDEDGVLFYDKIPDYEKERNIILMTGWMGEDPEDYIKLPLPYGYNVFSVAGTHAEAVAAGTEESTEAAKNLVLAVAGSFSPIGFEDSDEAQSLFLKNLTPTIFRSITQVGVNENFAGSPIYREDFPFGTPTPDSSRSFRSTPEAYQGFAKFLNEFTGGTSNISGAIDVNPDVMQHLVNYYGGGAWGFVEKTADFAKRVATGEEVERYRVPFAGRFSGNVSEYGDMQRFYERRDELGQIANEADSLRGREKIDYRRDHQQQLRLFNRATNLEKQLTELRKRRDRIEETETLTDEAKKRRTEMVEKQMKRRIDDFNKRYNKIK
ncbi:hypothetical protein HLV40_07010 [Chromohalobacter salexigens]|nr:hypothetical protein [Chromohalobacter salexigens]